MPSLKRPLQLFLGLALVLLSAFISISFHNQWYLGFGILVGLGEVVCSYSECEICFLLMSFTAYLVLAGFAVISVVGKDWVVLGISLALLIVNLWRSYGHAITRRSREISSLTV